KTVLPPSGVRQQRNFVILLQDDPQKIRAAAVQPVLFDFFHTRGVRGIRGRSVNLPTRICDDPQKSIPDAGNSRKRRVDVNEISSPFPQVFFLKSNSYDLERFIAACSRENREATRAC